jgi:hypothetical protein
LLLIIVKPSIITFKIDGPDQADSRYASANADIYGDSFYYSRESKPQNYSSLSVSPYNPNSISKYSQGTQNQHSRKPFGEPSLGEVEVSVD